MARFELSEADVELLNSKIGLKYLLAEPKVNLEKVLRLARYEERLRELQAEFVNLQQWVIETGQKVVILFEGRDAAGKGGAIRRMTAHINPRHYKIVALPIREQGWLSMKCYLSKFTIKNCMCLYVVDHVCTVMRAWCK